MANKKTVVGEFDEAATADSLVKRDASGRMKAATGVASDDVVNVSQMDSAVAAGQPAVWRTIIDGKRGVQTPHGGGTTGPALIYMAQSGDNLVVVGSQGSSTTAVVYYSNDGGDTWTETSGAISAAIRNNADSLAHIYIDSATSWTIAFKDSTSDLAIAKTTNSGASWTENTKALTAVKQMLVIDLDTVMAVDGTSDAKFYKTTDAGATWTVDGVATMSGLGVIWPKFDSFDGSHVMMMAADNSPQELRYNTSTDGGATWGTETTITNPFSTGNIGLNEHSIHLEAFSDTGYVAAVTDGTDEVKFIRTTNSGTNWSTVFDQDDVPWSGFVTSAERTNNARALVRSPGGRLIAFIDHVNSDTYQAAVTGQAMNIIISDDDGATWTVENWEVGLHASSADDQLMYFGEASPNRTSALDDASVSLHTNPDAANAGPSARILIRRLQG